MGVFLRKTNIPDSLIEANAITFYCKLQIVQNQFLISIDRPNFNCVNDWIWRKIVFRVFNAGLTHKPQIIENICHG